MSWAWIKINPVAETDKGELICKWVSQINLSGASSAIRYDIGWIVTSSQGIVYEYQSDTLDLANDGLSRDERVKLTTFTARTSIKQIPENVRENITGDIAIIKHSDNFYTRTAVSCDSLYLLKNAPVFHTVKGITSSKYPPIMPTSKKAKYSRNGIELKTTYRVDGYLHEFCPSFTLENQPILNALFFSNEDLDIYEVDAFIFSNKN